MIKPELWKIKKYYVSGTDESIDLNSSFYEENYNLYRFIDLGKQMIRFHQCKFLTIIKNWHIHK